MSTTKDWAYDDMRWAPHASRDSLIADWIAHGIQPDREGWIDSNWGPDVPKNWTWEHEDEIPEPLQDWTKVGKPYGR
jgi:hypothetical protein